MFRLALLLAKQRWKAVALDRSVLFAAMVDLLRSSPFQVYNLIFPSFNAVLPLHPFTGLLLQAANKLDKSNFPTAAIKTADRLLYKIHFPEVDA